MIHFRASDCAGVLRSPVPQCVQANRAAGIELAQKALWIKSTDKIVVYGARTLCTFQTWTLRISSLTAAMSFWIMVSLPEIPCYIMTSTPKHTLHTFQRINIKTVAALKSLLLLYSHALNLYFRSWFLA